MNGNHSRRFRYGLIAALALGGVAAWQHDIVSRVAYAVEKGKLEAGQENLQKLAKVEEISDVFRQVAKQVKPAVVLIRTTSATKPVSNRRPRNMDPKDLPEPFRQFFEDFGEGRQFEMPSPPSQQSSGSGVIIDAERGLIVTNNHVVSESENSKTRIDVHLPDGRRVKGEVLGTDPKTDLALVQIKADRLHGVPLGDSSKMEVGDWVLAVGAPFGLDQTVTQGIISATGRSNLDIAKYGDFLQTDAAINPGNSGGPLVNMRGEVIGINTAIATNGLAAGYMGVGFAIPSNMVKDIQPSLEKGEEVVRGYLGVSIRGLDTFETGFAENLGLAADATGVYVEEVMPGTPASKAGLKVEDVILSYDGHKVKTAAELQKLVAHTRPDDKVDMEVWRDKKAITIPITIEKQPKNFFERGQNRRGNRDPQEEEGDPEGESSATIDTVGVTVEPLTEATARRYGWADEPDAIGMLVVTQVEPLSDAAQLMNVGDLIVSVQGDPIKSVAELRQALSKTALAKGVRIRVRSPRLGYRTLFLQLDSAER
jgi:serine protease Do